MQAEFENDERSSRVADLVQLLKDPDPDVRASAARELKKLAAAQAATDRPHPVFRGLSRGALIVLGLIQLLIGLAMLGLLAVRILLDFGG